MKIKKYVLLGAATLAFAIINVNHVQAATVPQSSQQVSDNSLSQNDISEIDQYVNVKNNEFVLNIPENTNISVNKIRLAQQ